MTANARDEYAGMVGRAREEFCARFIEKKQEVFRRIRNDVMAQISPEGAAVTCHKGCSVCCVQYVEAAIQECEAIAYYLHSNAGALAYFLQKHDDWRGRMRDLGNPFARCEEILHMHGQVELSHADRAALMDSLVRYHEQDIPCSFLDNGACSIYEVRPYVCANHYVTTPEEWCRARTHRESDDPYRPRIYMTSIDEIYDRSFYHGNLSKPVVVFMPTTVYRIVTGGLEYVAELTRLSTLSQRAR